MPFQIQFISPIFLELNIARIKPSIYQQINAQLSLLFFQRLLHISFLRLKTIPGEEGVKIVQMAAKDWDYINLVGGFPRRC